MSLSFTLLGRHSIWKPEHNCLPNLILDTLTIYYIWVPSKTSVSLCLSLSVQVRPGIHTLSYRHAGVRFHKHTRKQGIHAHTHKHTGTYTGTLRGFLVAEEERSERGR